MVVDHKNTVFNFLTICKFVFAILFHAICAQALVVNILRKTPQASQMLQSNPKTNHLVGVSWLLMPQALMAPFCSRRSSYPPNTLVPARSLKINIFMYRYLNIACRHELNCWAPSHFFFLHQQNFYYESNVCRTQLRGLIRSFLWYSTSERYCITHKQYISTTIYV